VDEQSEIEVVRRLNGVFDRYDFVAIRDAMEGSSPDAVSSGILELNELVRDSISPDVSVEFHGAFQLPEGRRYEGRERYLNFFRGWLAAFEDYRLEHDNYELRPDGVLVDVAHVGHGRGSGLPVEFRQCQRWVLRDGVVAEIHVYENREQACPRGSDAEELVASSVRAFSARDWDALELLWDPAGTIVPPVAWPEAERLDGWPAIRGQYERLTEALAGGHVSALSITEVTSETVLAAVQWSGAGTASGLAFDTPMWMVCSVRAGRLSRIEYFRDEASACVAAGV
jgi:ketosteroid isomerase-like protein